MLRLVDLWALLAEPLGRQGVPRAAVALAIVGTVDERHESGEMTPRRTNDDAYLRLAPHRARDRGSLGAYLGGHEAVELE